MIKYRAKVTAVGPLANEFFESDIIVFFGGSAPEELHEHSVLHDGEILHSDVCPGDMVYIAGKSYVVRAVGSLANKNLRNLGHVVLKFNGQSEVEMEGDINVTAKPLPHLTSGSIFSIRG